jgi:hypothetical protein
VLPSVVRNRATGVEAIEPGWENVMSQDEGGRAAPICQICFEEIPPDAVTVRAAEQLDVSLSSPRAGRIDGRIIVCDEKCWATLRLSGKYRRLPDT